MGYRQKEGEITGLEILQDELHQQCENNDSRVLLRAWNDDPSTIAERIWSRRPEEEQPYIVLIGYSYGGYSSVLIARELKKRGIDVSVLILCDAVWRPYWWLPSLLSYLQCWKIKIPENVKRVYAFFQRTNYPRGHQLECNTDKTVVSTKLIPGVIHRYMDEDKSFHTIAKRNACPRK